MEIVSTPLGKYKSTKKGRCNLVHMKLSRKVIALSSVLAVIILSGVIMRIQFNETATNMDSIEILDYQRLVTQSELEGGLCDFDKVKKAHVQIAVLDSEINSVNIFLETTEVISDSEIEDIVLFASESLKGLEEGKISVAYTVS